MGIGASEPRGRRGGLPSDALVWDLDGLGVIDRFLCVNRGDPTSCDFPLFGISMVWVGSPSHPVPFFVYLGVDFNPENSLLGESADPGLNLPWGSEDKPYIWGAVLRVCHLLQIGVTLKGSMNQVGIIKLRGFLHTWGPFVLREPDCKGYISRL